MIRRKLNSMSNYEHSPVEYNSRELAVALKKITKTSEIIFVPPFNWQWHFGLWVSSDTNSYLSSPSAFLSYDTNDTNDIIWFNSSYDGYEWNVYVI